jgi:hypothetical protein
MRALLKMGVALDVVAIQNNKMTQLNIRGLLFDLPPFLTAPSDLPFAAPLSPETKPRKKEWRSVITTTSSKISEAHHRVR